MERMLQVFSASQIYSIYRYYYNSFVFMYSAYEAEIGKVCLV